MNSYSPEKMLDLINANLKMELNDIESRLGHNNIIFVYSLPKVGSTSLVSSLILFSFNRYVIIHIHDEIMLKTLYGIENITIREIIEYNAYLQRNVFVIDIYRSPVEHRISEFFENIHTFHFNTSAENVNEMSIEKLSVRFNSIFPHIVDGDIFLDAFDFENYFFTHFSILNTDKLVTDVSLQDINGVLNEKRFDFENKYFFLERDGIKFLKLRLKDIDFWRPIIFYFIGIDCVLTNDYSTDSKSVSKAFNTFKENYRIPVNLLELFIENNRYLSFYYSCDERREYLELWRRKSCVDIVIPFTKSEYELYNKISVENQTVVVVDRNHYLYNGCLCQGCLIKRNELIAKLMRGETTGCAKITHEDASIELRDIKNNFKLKRVEKINELIKNHREKIMRGKFSSNPRKINLL